MSEGQRRLQEAFEKAKERDALDAALPFSTNLPSSSTANTLHPEHDEENKQSVLLRICIASDFMLIRSIF